MVSLAMSAVLPSSRRLLAVAVSTTAPLARSAEVNEELRPVSILRIKRRARWIKLGGNGISSFVLATQMLQKTEWTPEVINQRQEICCKL
jgi:hypothetical protein